MTFKGINMHLTIEDLWSYVNNEMEAGHLQSIRSHLSDCDACREKLYEIEREEKAFRALDYPVPSEDFTMETAHLAGSGIKEGTSLWIPVFKAFLVLSLLLICTLSIWLASTYELKIPIPERSMKMIWYALPPALLAFAMKSLEGRMGQGKFL